MAVRSDMPSRNAVACYVHYAIAVERRIIPVGAQYPTLDCTITQTIHKTSNTRRERYGKVDVGDGFAVQDDRNLTPEAVANL